MPVADLREDKHYLADHPGMLPVTTAQVVFLIIIEIILFLNHLNLFFYPFFVGYIFVIFILMLGRGVAEADWCHLLHRVQLKNSAGWFINYFYV